MSEETRNAEAGKRQRQYKKQQRAEVIHDMSQSKLSRKNNEFIYQLNKQLQKKGFDEAKRQQALGQAKQRLLDEQSKGHTAKQIFGTPTAYAEELANPKKKEEDVPANSQYWLLAIDNGLMFLAIFAFMFGVLALMNPASLSRAGHYGNSGILAIVIVAVIGGALFGYIAKIMAPFKDGNGKWHRHGTVYKVVAIVLAFMLWIGAYFLTSGLPNSINPQLNKWAYLILGVIVFSGDLWMRAHFHIQNNVFGGSRQNQRKK